MAQINITLNQEEILQLLSTDHDGAFKTLLQEGLNSILKAESAEQLHAEKYERTAERKDSRNGVRERRLTTRIGRLTLEVPRHRNEPFKTMVFENYCRSEAALVATMAEMVVNGVSTRKVSRVMETLCDTKFSKSAVSEVCKDLDSSVNAFRNRPLEEEFPFVFLDATYFKVREDQRVISKAFMIAVGVHVDGVREILGFEPFRNESKLTWSTFISNLKKRGLKGVRMFISDAHEGILKAISQEYTDVPWQRCQIHFLRNIMESVPNKYKKGLSSELHEMFESRTLKEARQKRDEIIEDYRDVAEKAMDCLDNGFESAMTVMALPSNIRRYYRTSNHIERLNRELKRRSKAIGIFPNVESLIRLMGSVLVEQNEMYLLTKIHGYPKKAKLQLEICEPELKRIALEQRAFLAA